MLLASLLGAAIGLVMGLTGAGGGILAVPALVIGLGFNMTAATPIALMAVGISAMVGSVDGLLKRIVRYKAATLMAVLGAVIAPLGITLAHVIPDTLLMTLFGAIMLLVAWRMARQASGAAKAATQPGDSTRRNCMLDPATGRFRWTRCCTATLAGIGAIAGLLAGMLGVGGGFIIVPSLRRYTNIEMHSIVATSLMVIALISISTVLGILLQGARIPAMGWIFVAAAIAGMILGRAIVPYIASRLLQIGFALIATLVAVMMLVKTYFPGALG